MMRRIFGKKKDDDEKEEEETEEKVDMAGEATSEADLSVEEATSDETTESPEGAATPEGMESPMAIDSTTMPYHATIQDRLKYMLTEGSSAGLIEAPDSFKMEFMAMGERFTVLKDSMGAVTISSGSTPDEDVFIRIGNDVVAELLSASNFNEFTELYLKYYKNAEPGKFVKIELRKPITDLNRRGYARIPTLKLLIGAARI